MSNISPEMRKATQELSNALGAAIQAALVNELPNGMILGVLAATQHEFASQALATLDKSK